MNEKEKVVSIDQRSEAQKKYEEELKKAKEKCLKEIADLVDKRGFRFITRTILTEDGRVIHELDLAPK